MPSRTESRAKDAWSPLDFDQEAFRRFYDHLEPGGVEEIRPKVLREQLGIRGTEAGEPAGKAKAPSAKPPVKPKATPAPARAEGRPANGRGPGGARRPTRT